MNFGFQKKQAVLILMISLIASYASAMRVTRRAHAIMTEESFKKVGKALLSPEATIKEFIQTLAPIKKDHEDLEKILTQFNKNETLDKISNLKNKLHYFTKMGLLYTGAGAAVTASAFSLGFILAYIDHELLPISIMKDSLQFLTVYPVVITGTACSSAIAGGSLYALACAGERGYKIIKQKGPKARTFNEKIKYIHLLAEQAKIEETCAGKD